MLVQGKVGVSGNSKCLCTFKHLELMLFRCWGSFGVLSGNVWILGPSTPLMRVSIHPDFSFDPRICPSCPASSPTPIPILTIPIPQPQAVSSPGRNKSHSVIELTVTLYISMGGCLSVSLDSTLDPHLLLNSQRMPGSARVPPPPTLVQHGNVFQMLRC